MNKIEKKDKDKKINRNKLSKLRTKKNKEEKSRCQAYKYVENIGVESKMERQNELMLISSM